MNIRAISSLSCGACRKVPLMPSMSAANVNKHGFSNMDTAEIEKDIKKYVCTYMCITYCTYCENRGH
jgi:uncharacterized protein YuzB (UPF0349 family)